MNDVDFNGLIISDEEVKEINELISTGMNPGFIGFDNGINPDIFDLDQEYSNVENILKQLEKYDFLILKTNKKRLVQIPKKYFTCFRKDLVFVSTKEEDLINKIEEVFDNLNIKNESLKEIYITYKLDKKEIDKIESKYDCLVIEKPLENRGELITFDESFQLYQLQETYKNLKVSSTIDKDYNVILVPEKKIKDYKDQYNFFTNYLVYKDLDQVKQLLLRYNVLLLITDEDLYILKDLLKNNFNPDIELSFLNQELLKYNIITTETPQLKKIEEFSETTPNTLIALLNDSAVFTSTDFLDELEDQKNKKVLIGKEDSEIIGDYFFL